MRDRPTIWQYGVLMALVASVGVQIITYLLNPLLPTVEHIAAMAMRAFALLLLEMVAWAIWQVWKRIRSR
jgi:hypothetical protein